MHFVDCPAGVHSSDDAGSDEHEADEGEADELGGPEEGAGQEEEGSGEGEAEEEPQDEQVDATEQGQQGGSWQCKASCRYWCMFKMLIVVVDLVEPHHNTISSKYSKYILHDKAQPIVEPSSAFHVLLMHTQLGMSWRCGVMVPS